MGSAGIAIRPATPPDAAAVADIVQRAYQGYVDRLGVRPAPLDADHGAAIREGRVFVAGVDGVIAGLIVLVLEPAHLLVENVAVDPSLQHRGVGRDLLGFAEVYARERGRVAVRLFTHRDMDRNLRLYCELGYVREPPPAGDRSPRVFLVKRLARVAPGSTLRSAPPGTPPRRRSTTTSPRLARANA